MLCTECGAELKSGARFCGKCGSAISFPKEEENGDLNKNSKLNNSESISAGLSDQGKYYPGLDRSRKDVSANPKNGDRKAMYLYTFIFTLVAFVWKGAGSYAIGYVTPIPLILLAITAIPNKIIRWFLFILIAFFFHIIVFTNFTD